VDLEPFDWAVATDQDLVAQARAGDESAVRALVERYQRPVYSLVRRLVGDPQRAEELAQDAFVKALRALDRYDPERRFASWLFKIAANTALDELRRRRAAPIEEPLPETATAPTSPEAGAAASELRAHLEAALARLRPEYRAVVLLRHVEGRSQEEIAEILGVPVGTVKTHLHRARRQLQAYLAHLRA